VKPTVQPDVAHALAMAILASSAAPALLIDGDRTILAASTSFLAAFALEPEMVVGLPLFAVAGGVWNIPQFRSLLTATIDGDVRIDSYEMDLKSGSSPRRLVVGATKLAYGADVAVRVLLTVTDVTEARVIARMKDDLLREKGVLLRELQHRVANSLQIIASVLMQSARRVQSEEARSHLHDARNRVMAIATLSEQLAVSRLGDVELRGYFSQLCESLGASMIHDRDRLKLEVAVDDSVVTADVSVSLGLIVTELVINALKHAFPGDRPGRIVVDYHADAADWTLSVSDDGIGTLTGIADAKPGLGTSIVEALANQLGAVVASEDVDPGLRFAVSHVDGQTRRSGK
jgi:two-component sensor histidine kinase